MLSSTYIAGGMSLALIFKRNYLDISTLYMWDLFGAGMGVIGSILLMNWIGTPAATFVVAIPIIMAAVLASKKFMKVIPISLFLILVPLLLNSESLLEMKREEPAPIVYKHWDALSKIKIYDGDGYRRINLDNAANTGVNEFDGNWDIPDSLKFGFPIVEQVIAEFDSCRFLSLGSGGGQDVFQGLQYGAAEVHAVEVNGHINDLLTDGELADFSGHIYTDPRVKVVTEDARTYIRRYSNYFDVIYSFSSNSFAALASGAFALAENYLFTTEAFEDYWDALSDNGYLIMEHQFYMPRIVSEVKEALKNKGIENPEDYFAVYGLNKIRRKMLLLSKKPLPKKLIENAFVCIPPENPFYAEIEHPAPDSLKGNLIDRIVMSGWEVEQDSALTNLAPCTDDKPFIAQMGLWKNFNFDSMKEMRALSIYGFPLAQVLIVTILAVLLVIVLPINFLPLLVKRGGMKLKHLAYFFFIGAAFMIVEVMLIQRYTLFIGPSVYSLATILLVLLISSAIGSKFSGWFEDKTSFIAIITLIVLESFLFPLITSKFVGFGMLPRMLISALLIAPLGFFMGMPFPKGVKKVKEFVDWGFAINGAASVLGSTLIILIAMNFGITISLLCGATMYGFAFISSK